MAIQSLQYHNQTSYKRNTLGGHLLDWDNQPSIYKSYPGVEPIPLSESSGFPEVPFSELMLDTEVRPSARCPGEVELSQILRLTCSLTAKASTAMGPFYYRSVASAGALYPTELYLATPEVSGRDGGLYHYSVAQQGITPLRSGQFNAFLKQAAQWPEGFYPGLTFFISVIFFRSAWKYRDRAFRYHLLDTGHLLENLLLALKAQKLSWTLTYDFDDIAIDHFLGLDSSREATLALISLPDPDQNREPELRAIPDLDPLVLQASRVADTETRYPIIQELVNSASAHKGRDVVLPTDPLGFDVKKWLPLERQEQWPEKIKYPANLFSRRSKRNFIRQSVSAEAFKAILEGVSAEISCNQDIPEHSESSHTVGLLVGQVEGFIPGFYLLDRSTYRLGLVKEGNFLWPMAHISLDQMWLAQAGFHLLFISDPADLDHHRGPRGYRYSLISAGRLGERLYLLATALGLGCCGIGAFYDQEAAELLGLDGNNRLIYFLAVGVIKK